MNAPITTAQAMRHPDVALTINTLGQMADELRAENDSLEAGKAEMLGYFKSLAAHLQTIMPIGAYKDVFKLPLNPTPTQQAIFDAVTGEQA